MCFHIISGENGKLIFTHQRTVLKVKTNRGPQLHFCPKDWILSRDLVLLSHADAYFPAVQIFKGDTYVTLIYRYIFLIRCIIFALSVGKQLNFSNVKIYFHLTEEIKFNRQRWACGGCFQRRAWRVGRETTAYTWRPETPVSLRSPLQPPFSYAFRSPRKYYIYICFPTSDTFF